MPIGLLFVLLTLTLIDAPAFQPAREAGGELPTWTVDRLDEGRGEAIVTLGAFFRPGRFDDREVEAMILLGGRRLRPQTTVLARHDDETVRFARFSLALRAPRGEILLRLRLIPRREAPESAFSIAETAEGLAVSDGVVAFTLSRDPARALLDLRLARAARPALRALTTGEARGEAEIEVEEDGPSRLVLRQIGRIAATARDAPLRLDRRVVLEAGSGRVLVETWLETEAASLPREGINHRLELGFEPRRLLAGTVGLKPSELEAPLAIDRFGRSTRGEAAAAVAHQGLLLQGSGQALRVEVEDLLERGPGELKLEDGLLILPLVSGRYRWRPGRAASRRIVLTLARGSRARPRGAARVVVRRSGEGLPAAAIGDREGLRDLRARLGRALEPEARRQSGFDWRGELNFGDWRWSKMDAGNLEYDSILGLRLAARDLGRPELLRRSRAALGHLLRVDRSPSGLPFRHGPGHVGGLEAGHMWLEGAVHEALSDADPFLLERLHATVAAWRAGLRRIRPERELCRSLAWSIILGSAIERELAEAGLGLELAPLYRAIASAPGGAAPLFDRLPVEEGEAPRYLASPWVTIGLLGEALAHAAEGPGLAGARARWRRGVRALAGQVWNEAAGWPVARIVQDEEGRTLELAGRMEGEEALFLALGLSRIDDADAVEIALRDRAFAWARLNLGLDRKSLNGIELSQLMWLLPRFVSPG